MVGLDELLRFFLRLAVWVVGLDEITNYEITNFFWWWFFNVRRRRRNVGFLLFVVPRLAAAYPDGLTQIWQIFSVVGGASQSRQLKSV